MRRKLSARRPKTYRKRIAYLVARVPAGVLPFAMRLADNSWYGAIRVRVDRCGDLLFEGLLIGAFSWADRRFIEAFYLRRERPWIDLAPIRTIWGTF